MVQRSCDRPRTAEMCYNNSHANRLPDAISTPCAMPPQMWRYAAISHYASRTAWDAVPTVPPGHVWLNGGLNLYVIFKNDPIKNVDPMGLFTSGEFLRKVRDEQDCIWRNEYEGPAIDVVETLSIFSIASVIEGIASSSTTSALGVMADTEISNGLLAGANTTGNIIQKIGAAEKGANVIGRHGDLQESTDVASRVSAVRGPHP